MPRIIALAVLLLLDTPPLSGQGSPAARFDSARAFIRQAMERHDLPAVAVAVALDGRILWEEGFGWADRERRVPATPHTLFSLASITKPMTATAVMRLVEQERVQLDRPANDYLAGAKIHGYRWSPEDATVRRVLSHTAGLPRHAEFVYQGEDHPARSVDEAITHYGVLVAPPGEEWVYSNLGYGILESIVERVSGRSYPDYLQAEVFEPLGMTRSRASNRAALGDAAAVRYGPDRRPLPAYDPDMRGYGVVHTSVHDLIRFGIFHLGGRLPGQRAVLREGTRRAMQQISSPRVGDEAYGLGWVIDQDNGYRRVFHDGAMPGVGTILSLYPEAKLAVAVLVNTDELPVAARISREIASAVLPRYAAAHRARTAAQAGAAAPQAPFAPGPELLGEWRGVIRTYQDSVPLTLLVQPDGDVHVRLGEGLRTLLSDVSFHDGLLRGRFAGAIPTDDARRHPHVVELRLWMREGRLVGAVAAHAEQGPFFDLSSYAELARTLGAP